MTIGATYLRIAPNGDKSFITIETQQEAEYHEGLKEEGFIYQRQAVSTASDAGNYCISCEG